MALKRLLFLIPMLVVVSSVTFFLMYLIPGDPTDLILGEFAKESDKLALRKELGIDGGLFVRYWNFLQNLFSLEFGNSLLSGQSVGSLILQRLPATLELSFYSSVLSCLWGIPAGIFSASQKSQTKDLTSTSLSILGMSIPGYFLGPILIWVFAVKFSLFPIGGRDEFLSFFLPSLSLALPLGAILMRITRAAIKESLTEEYIRVAYSKGISKRRLYYKHALRNAMIPILTVVGLQLGTLLSGTVITETIFSWPGIGTLLFDAIQQRDYPIVQACIIVIASIYLVVNFITDLLYIIANPKIKAA